MLTSLIVFTLLYGILAVIEIGLVVKYVKIGAAQRGRGTGPDPAWSAATRRWRRQGVQGTDEHEEKPMAFAY